MKQYIKWFAAAVLVSVLAGCTRTSQIAEVQSIVSAGHTQGQVKNAILKAGIERQWVMSELSPGVIKARQQTRDHVAEVRIIYSATSYSIQYISSLNLKAANGKIHKTYNRWVLNLNKDIQVNLSARPSL